MTRKLFRFKPVHFLWMKARLEREQSRASIAREFKRRWGGPEKTVTIYLTRYFPSRLLKGANHQERKIILQRMLWELRHNVDSRVKRIDRQRKRAARTPGAQTLAAKAAIIKGQKKGFVKRRRKELTFLHLATLDAQREIPTFRERGRTQNKDYAELMRRTGFSSEKVLSLWSDLIDIYFKSRKTGVSATDLIEEWSPPPK